MKVKTYILKAAASPSWCSLSRLCPLSPFLRHPFHHIHTHTYTHPYSQTEQGLIPFSPLASLCPQAHKQRKQQQSALSKMHFRSTNRLFRLLPRPRPAVATHHHRMLSSSKPSSNPWLRDKSVSIYVDLEGCAFAAAILVLHTHTHIY